MAETKRKVGRPKGSGLIGVNRLLTRKQELFVKELVSKDGQITKRQAAINAGYPEKSAHSKAYELTNPKTHPHVCQAIRKYRQELDEKFGIDFKRHVRDLKIIRDKALEDGAYSAATQAEIARGRAHGDIYVNKSEIRHGSIDQMDRDQVMKALQELKSEFGASLGQVIDVTPRKRRRSKRALSGQTLKKPSRYTNPPGHILE